MSNDLRRWRKQATAEEWKSLARMANTSVGYLDQIAYAFRRASPSKASDIEMATREFEKYEPVSKESLVFAQSRITAA